MTLEISPHFLARFFSAVIGYTATCSFDPNENMYVLDVFMVPAAYKTKIEDEIYDLIDLFKQETGWDLFMAVIIVTDKETHEYYPEMVSPPDSPTPVVISVSPANNDESMAA